MTHNAMMIAARPLQILFALVLVISPLTAQKNSNANAVLATVGSEKVIYKDVERAFQKNLSRRQTPFSSVDRDTALDFINLYTNYRLKVASAIEREVDKDPAVVADINNNRKLLSETWYFDKMFAKDRIDELARRRTKEIRIGIILCSVRDAGMKYWDTTRTAAKAESVMALLKSGADFEQLARDSSDDAETGKKGGMLPWISGGSIIKAVEDEAYSLDLNEVSSEPIQTQFGYFIVRVYALELRQVVTFRHILLQKKEDRDSAASVVLALDIISVLNADEDKQAAMLRERGVEFEEDIFSALAKKYSDDETSANKGGSLGSAYSRSGGMESNGSRLVADFEAGIFGVQDGEVSAPVATVFGIHIIERVSTQNPDAIKERDVAKRTYRRLYFEDDKRILYDSLKTANGYTWNLDVRSELMKVIDTTRNTSDTSWWRTISAPLMQENIFSLPSGALTVENFTDSLRQRLDLRGYTLNTPGFVRAMNKIVDPIVLDKATRGLENEYPDFASLLQEFNDGILLFKVEEQEVWSKLKFDTTEAKVFYDTTMTRWMTEQRYEVSEIFLLTDSAGAIAMERLDNGDAFGDVAGDMTARDGGREKNGSLGTISPRTHAIARVVESEDLKTGDVYGPYNNEKGISIIRLDRIVLPRQQTFNEALNDLAPAYQDALQKRLTDEWLSEVKKRFPVKVMTKTVNRIWKAGSR